MLPGLVVTPWPNMKMGLGSGRDSLCVTWVGCDALAEHEDGPGFRERLPVSERAVGVVFLLGVLTLGDRARPHCVHVRIASLLRQSHQLLVALVNKNYHHHHHGWLLLNA